MSESNNPPKESAADEETTAIEASKTVPTNGPESSVAIPRPPLEQIGNYRLVSRLGTGGMGEVWLAEHVDHPSLKAAVKFIRSDHVDPGIRGRFLRERESMVRLRHENIVKVSDLGVTSNGLPYLLMEYVEGTPIDVYCNTKRLSVPRRLELFLQVCRAVQHAHNQGLIHRDLKPANILVTEMEENGAVRPVAKVIDFGIARALESTDARPVDSPVEVSTVDPLLTQTGMFIGSLLYASPEQLLTQPVDIRTDVYSLGVILYQLLSGTTPITAQEAEAMFREARANVLERHAGTSRTPPSVKVQTVARTNPKKLAEWAEQRGVLDDQLAAILANELDWITLKTLEVDRERRYSSVEALAADVERYLKDELVEARKPDLKYRAGKMWRRNHRSIVAAVLIVVVIAGAAIAITAFKQRATDQRAQLDKIAAEEAAEKDRLAAERERVAARKAAASAEAAAEAAERERLAANALREEVAQQKAEAAMQKKNAEAAAERERATLASLALPDTGAVGWTILKIGEHDFVALDNVVRFYDFGPLGREGKDAIMSTKSLVLKGTADSPDLTINGIKLVLCDPLLEIRGKLWLSRLDLVKTLDPILRPGKMQNPSKVDNVVLDAGAGGHDKGAESPYGFEKYFTLDVANRAKQLLESQGFHVSMTRSEDRFVPDGERLRIANQTANAVLISIHFNYPTANASGSATFAFAPRGVPSVTQDGPRTSDLEDCVGNSHDAENIALATALHATFRLRSNLPDGGVKRARFDILQGSRIPAAYIAGGFLGSESDAVSIAKQEYRQQMAASILAAVQNYRRAIAAKGAGEGIRNTPPPPLTNQPTLKIP